MTMKHVLPSALLFWDYNAKCCVTFVDLLNECRHRHQRLPRIVQACKPVQLHRYWYAQFTK